MNGAAELQGRCALVTGSTASLGLAIADRLAAAGARIVLHNLLADEPARQARDALARRHGTDVLLQAADLNEVDQIEAMAHEARHAFGGIDIVVNNAVVRHFGPADTLPRNQWDEALAVNVSAAFHLARLSIPGMRSRGWGRIINMSSVYGSGATANRVGYITTKTALIGLTRALAVETAQDGITCNAVAPGTVPTPTIASRIAGIARDQGISEQQAQHDYLAHRQPTGRFVDMANVAALIGFLCSDAGRDITGALLPIDGGWTAA
ncbi:SDR family oxidoreductase [Bordetella petrii]|uniref:3-hydroxybutyrate dehydrogenase n=1 Tax=Bordetella petrii (strain ATCC BAA-461 / DSM 12804 / CCUG 43448 / CIP 107267 / Se-1111R) TaxID=340100 RepID=A9IGS3_BORPD|nr:SDR family oxidoreductase [Bordetella petrii]CAP41986.1 3-hydroxybutyrate dehydrogenase [Bordetella petrii]